MSAQRFFTVDIFLGVSKILFFGWVAFQTESVNVFDVVPALTLRPVSVKPKVLAFLKDTHQPWPAWLSG